MVPAVALFIWVVAVLLVLLYLLFLLVYHCVHFVVVFGTVGTGGCSAIGMEVVVGREPGCWVGKGLGEGAGKEQGEDEEYSNNPDKSATVGHMVSVHTTVQNAGNSP